MTRNWTVPVWRLSGQNIYDLSQKLPNWSEMDPYSDLEEDTHNDTAPSDQNQPIATESIDIALGNNTPPPIGIKPKMGILPPATACNRYQL